MSTLAPPFTQMSSFPPYPPSGMPPYGGMPGSGEQQAFPGGLMSPIQSPMQPEALPPLGTLGGLPPYPMNPQQQPPDHFGTPALGSPPFPGGGLSLGAAPVTVSGPSPMDSSKRYGNWWNPLSWGWFGWTDVGVLVAIATVIARALKRKPPTLPISTENKATVAA